MSSVWLLLGCMQSCLHYAAGQGDAASAEAILERVGAELVDTGDDNQVGSARQKTALLCLLGA